MSPEIKKIIFIMFLVSILMLALGQVLIQSETGIWPAFGYLFLFLGGVLMVLSALCFFSPNLRNTNSEQLDNWVTPNNKNKKNQRK